MAAAESGNSEESLEELERSILIMCGQSEEADGTVGSEADFITLSEVGCSDTTPCKSDPCSLPVSPISKSGPLADNASLPAKFCHSTPNCKASPKTPVADSDGESSTSLLREDREKTFEEFLAEITQLCTEDESSDSSGSNDNTVIEKKGSDDCAPKASISRIDLSSMYHSQKKTVPSHSVVVGEKALWSEISQPGYFSKSTSRAPGSSPGRFYDVDATSSHHVFEEVKSEEEEEEEEAGEDILGLDRFVSFAGDDEYDDSSDSADGDVTVKHVLQQSISKVAVDVGSVPVHPSQLGFPEGTVYGGSMEMSKSSDLIRDDVAVCGGTVNSSEPSGTICDDLRKGSPKQYLSDSTMAVTPNYAFEDTSWVPDILLNTPCSDSYRDGEKTVVAAGPQTTGTATGAKSENYFNLYSTSSVDDNDVVTDHESLLKPVREKSTAVTSTKINPQQALRQATVSSEIGASAKGQSSSRPRVEKTSSTSDILAKKSRPLPQSGDGVDKVSLAGSLVSHKRKLSSDSGETSSHAKSFHGASALDRVSPRPASEVGEKDKALAVVAQCSKKPHIQSSSQTARQKQEVASNREDVKSASATGTRSKESEDKGGEKTSLTLANKLQNAKTRPASVVVTVPPVMELGQCYSALQQNIISAEENDLMRQVRKRWQTGIIRPDINLTCCNYLRRREPRAWSYLEGNFRKPPLLRHLDSCLGQQPDWRQGQGTFPKSGTLLVQELERQLQELRQDYHHKLSCAKQELCNQMQNLRQEENYWRCWLICEQKKERDNLCFQFACNPLFLEHQLLLLHMEHGQQQQQQQQHYAQQSHCLRQQAEAQLQQRSQRFSHLESQLQEMIKLFRTKDSTVEGEQHVLVSLWKGPCRSNNQKGSWIQVGLPADIASYILREDEIYDAFYSYK